MPILAPLLGPLTPEAKTHPPAPLKPSTVTPYSLFHDGLRRPWAQTKHLSSPLRHLHAFPPSKAQFTGSLQQDPGSQL